MIASASGGVGLGLVPAVPVDQVPGVGRHAPLGHGAFPGRAVVPLLELGLEPLHLGPGGLGVVVLRRLLGHGRGGVLAALTAASRSAARVGCAACGRRGACRRSAPGPWSARRAAAGSPPRCRRRRCLQPSYTSTIVCPGQSFAPPLGQPTIAHCTRSATAGAAVADADAEPGGPGGMPPAGHRPVPGLLHQRRRPPQSGSGQRTHRSIASDSEIIMPRTSPPAPAVGASKSGWRGLFGLDASPRDLEIAGVYLDADEAESEPDGRHAGRAAPHVQVEDRGAGLEVQRRPMHQVIRPTGFWVGCTRFLAIDASSERSRRQ